MKVYLAAPYATRDSLRPLAEELESIGVDVTSTWLKEDVKVTAETCGTAPAIEDGQAATHVLADFRDIEKCDVLVLFTTPMWGAYGPLKLVGGHGNSGGRHVETGYALHAKKQVLVVGRPENIFHRTLSVVKTWHEAVLWLVAHERTMPQDRMEEAK